MRKRRHAIAQATETSTNPSSTHVVYAALLGNVLVAATKTGAAAWTGSSAMLSEAIHSFVDIGNEVLLLYGQRRSVRRADPEHPLGYGRELYFWSFIVALLVFALGAGGSLYQGVVHILHPIRISDPIVNYIVLGLAFLLEGSSWFVAARQFSAAKGQRGFYEAFLKSKDPPSFMVFFEDSAALLGILIAAIGTFAAVQLDLPVLDGIASILIALILGGMAILLARESKSLLIGERADPELTASILNIAAECGSAVRVNGLLTLQLAPSQILAALSLEFADDFRASEIENHIIELERKIRAAHPDIVTLFVKPQPPDTFKQAVRHRYGKSPD